MFTMFLFMVLDLDSLMIIPVLIFNISFVIGIGGLNLVYTTEVVLPRAIGICVATQYLASSVIGKSTPFLMDSVGPSTIMLFYSITSLVVSVVNTLYVVETQGKTEMEIFFEIKKMKLGGVLFAEKELRNRLKSILRSKIQTPSKNYEPKKSLNNPQEVNSFYFKDEEGSNLPRSPTRKSFPRVGGNNPPEP